MRTFPDGGFTGRGRPPLVVGNIQFAPRSWDSIARRYVEHDTTAQETFGDMPKGGGYVKDTPTAANYNAWRNIIQPYVDDHPRKPGERQGDWMQLYSGHQFWPLDPRASEIHITDIAHALSMQCRYAGHCKRFYSVAEHSVHLSRVVSTENALWALLHDASEAYLVDVPRPVKPYLTGYKAAEAKVMAAVCERFGLPPEMPAEVHEADGQIIADERANMAPCVAPWAGYDKPIGVVLQFWSPAEAEAEFLAAYEELQNMRVAA